MSTLPIKLTEAQTRILHLLARDGGRARGWTYGTQSQTNAIMRQLVMKGLVTETTPMMFEKYGCFELNDVGFAVAVTNAVENNVRIR